MKLNISIMDPNPPKRNKRGHETDSEIENRDSAPSWPRFLIMEGTAIDTPLKSLSPFAISKGIQGIAGEPKNVKSISQGLLIEVAKKSHSDNLLKCKEIANVPVKVTAHRTLNSRKGVVRCRELANMDEEDIRRELGSQKVSHVKRISIDKGRKPTNTYIMTFERVELPLSIKVGYLNVKVTEYIPSPLRCFKCQRYGHGSSRCNREERCSRCAGHHSVDQCTASALCCANCSENSDHAASDKMCPVYIKEQQVQKIRHTENISFPEARKRVESTSLSSSYATIVKTTAPVSVKSIATQTNLTWPGNQTSPAEITDNSAATQTDNENPIPSTSEPTKPVEIRRNKQQVNKSKGQSGKNRSSPKDSHITTSNKFSELERMDTEEVHDSSSSSRSRSRSPIKPP